MAVVDFLPSRQFQDLKRYFIQIPLEERQRVKAVRMDMWHTYPRITNDTLPNAYCSADCFYIIQDFSRMLTSVCVKAMNAIKPPESWKKSDDATYRINQIDIPKKRIT